MARCFFFSPDCIYKIHSRIWTHNAHAALAPQYSAFNTGCSLRPNLNFEPKFQDCDKILAICEELEKMLGGNKPSEIESDIAYSLGTWEQFPGEDITIPAVIIQNLSRKFLLFRCLKKYGVNGGKKESFISYANFVRTLYK